jgi:plasmid stabilization system protein ParE
VRNYRLTLQASADLFVVWSFICDDNLDAADRVESAILDACRLLAKNPRIGQLRADITSLPVRFWPVQKYPNYVIVYAPDTKPLEIIRILHGARDLAALFGSENS